MTRLPRIALACALAWGAAQPATAGVLISGEAEAPSLGRPMAYRAYETDGVTRCTRLPVLVLLHGHGGRGADWIEHGDLVRTMDMLYARGDVPAMVVVMPDGGDSWWIDSPAGRFGQAWTRDLVAHFERRWPTGGAAARLSAGLSAGGFGVINALLRQPQDFAAVAAMSPAAYRDLPPPASAARLAPAFQGPSGFDASRWQAVAWPALWDHYAGSRHRVPIHLSSGDQDALGIALEAARLHEGFRQIQPGRTALRIVAGGHDWQVWKRMLPEVIVHLARAALPPLCAEPAQRSRPPRAGSAPQPGPLTSSRASAVDR